MIHLRLQVVDRDGQRVRPSKKRRAELLTEIIRVDPAANQPGRVAIVPLRETGYYATLEGHIQNHRRLPSGAGGREQPSGVADAMVHMSHEEIADNSAADPSSIGYRALQMEWDGEIENSTDAVDGESIGHQGGAVARSVSEGRTSQEDEDEEEDEEDEVWKDAVWAGVSRGAEDDGFEVEAGNRRDTWQRMSTDLASPDAEHAAEIDAGYGLTEEEQTTGKKFPARLYHRGAQRSAH